MSQIITQLHNVLLVYEETTRNRAALEALTVITQSSNSEETQALSSLVVPTIAIVGSSGDNAAAMNLLCSLTSVSPAHRFSPIDDLVDLNSGQG